MSFDSSLKPSKSPSAFKRRRTSLPQPAFEQARPSHRRAISCDSLTSATLCFSRKRRRSAPCRRLFPDQAAPAPERISDELRQLARAVADDTAANFKQRWNFDIDADKPEEGPYKWELLQPACSS